MALKLHLHSYLPQGKAEVLLDDCLRLYGGDPGCGS
jgi:hypothetical protein